MLNPLNKRHLALSAGVLTLFALAGCKAEISASASASSTGVVTVGTKITWHLNSQIQLADLSPSGFEQNPPSSFTIIANAPSDAFTVDPNSPPQTTLTATTDTGYTSSVTVTLQQVASTTAPVSSGDEVYTWTVPNTTALSNWAQAVASHTTNSMQLTSSSEFPLVSTKAGTYTLAVQINSNATGVMNEGSTSVTVPPTNMSCGYPSYHWCYRN